MKAKRYTKTITGARISSTQGQIMLQRLAKELVRQGYTYAFGDCPKGCTEIIEIYGYRWHGEWSGYSKDIICRYYK